MQFKKYFIGAIILATLAVSGCSSVPKASSTQESQAKLFNTHSEKSNLYIYRGDKEGASVKMDLIVDGQHVATNIGQTFIKLEVEPGKHVIVSQADNKERFSLATLKNKNYFIHQEVKVKGGYARAKLRLVSESVGQQGVKNCEMISAIASPTQLSMR